MVQTRGQKRKIAETAQEQKTFRKDILQRELTGRMPHSTRAGFGYFNIPEYRSIAERTKGLLSFGLNPNVPYSEYAERIAEMDIVPTTIKPTDTEEERRRKREQMIATLGLTYPEFRLPIQSDPRLAYEYQQLEAKREREREEMMRQFQERLIGPVAE